jgi:hypothetical protein
MKELKEFINEICGFYGDEVQFVFNVVGEEEYKFVEREGLLDIINELDVKEVIHHYIECIDFLLYDDKFMEISVL